MTNYNERLDEILHGMTGSKNLRPQRGVLAKSRDEAKQAILDWHNKQIEEVLDRLEADVWRRMATTSVITIINDERNKLKEANQ